MIRLIMALSFLISCSSNPKYTHIKYEEGFQRSDYESISDKIMIATQGRHSTEAGLQISSIGGNIFDVATAVSFAIAVERPQSTGLGGGGFLLADGPLSKGVKVFDFRETAPSRSNEKMYQDKNGNVIPLKSLNGALSIATPGMVRGILEIHKKYGQLSRQEVLEPAIQLAKNGFRVYPHLANAIKRREKVLKSFPSSKKIFFKGEKRLEVGDLLQQTDLAETLGLISYIGAAGFYEGDVAKKIVETIQSNDGIMSLEDLRNYTVKERASVHTDYRGYKIISMPPPSSGGVHIIQILNMLENDKISSMNYFDAQSVRLKVQAMELAFRDRAKYLGDPDKVFVPVGSLVSKSYAKELRGKFKANSKLDPVEIKNPKIEESNDTTHFTIMDAQGNVVSSTQTINYLFGSGLVADGTGIVLNDEMDDFSAKAGSSNVFQAIGGDKNKIESNKRPLSSMAPTIVKKDGKVILALGTPSGTRILTCVANVLMNVLDHKMELFDAVSVPRFHHQWKPDEIRVDLPGFPQETQAKLEKMGYKIKNKDLGCKIQAVGKKKGKLHGVSDPRGQGMAKGF